MSETYLITDHGAMPNSSELQTETIQNVINLCKDHGGTVIIPKGRFRIAGLRLWSDMTLILESGAELIGSENCDDYQVFDIPQNMPIHTDMEMIPVYYQNRPWETYRRAMISAYGGKNISIIGHPDSHINGMDCSDPEGEEGYRGPHGIFVTNVENLNLEGYSIENCGNFAHQIDTCTNIRIKNTRCIGGSDGFHLHCCNNILIEDSVMHTGDDCIGGINMTNMVIRNCEFNTSCDVFRAGGQNILVDNCHVFGPGIYPHRMTVVPGRHTEAVKDRKNDLPQSAGRHNTVCLWIHFASDDQPDKSPTRNVIFRNCLIENIDCPIVYHADCCSIETGAYISDISFENTRFEGLASESNVCATEKEHMYVHLKKTTATHRNGTPIKVIADDLPNITVVTD